MNNNHVAMWKELGLNLEAHHGLRIKELLDKKLQGRKIIGSYCVFVPEEIALAANATLVGLCSGADFVMEEVERYLPRNTCDGKKKAYESLGSLVDTLYVMDLPQMKSGQGRDLLRNEYDRFKNAVEKLTGVAITADSLKDAVNAKRSALHRLSMLRKADPATISGLDALLANQVFFYDNPARFTESANKICDELEKRITEKQGVALGKTPRILLSGCPMAVPNWKLPWIIETSGAVIVGEESCVGERGVRNLTEDKIMATGYGRSLFEIVFDDAKTVTEIKAHAKGVRSFFKDARTILDIGGQDSKAIALNKNGRVQKFEMNDRCAAGTGKFIEIMAKNLGFSIDEFGPAALEARKNLSINSMCTVFAESEVTSLIAKGANRKEIARGLHLSVVKRAAGMINRVSVTGPIVFSGGVAKNPCVRELIAQTLDRKIFVHENPQMIGALGAALILEEETHANN